MKIQQIRNATLKLTYNDLHILVDHWLQDKGTEACLLKQKTRR